MTPRSVREWWVGAVLAMAAGLGLSAPRASADCASRLPSLAMPALPFATPHRSEAPKPAPSRPAPAPCHGPNCHKAPADPTPSSPVPPPSPRGERWAWVEATPAPPDGVHAAWARGDKLLISLSSPSPLERPPR